MTGQPLPDQGTRPIGPHSTAGELALRLADLALDTFPSFKASEQDHVEMADRIVEAAVLWINQRHQITSTPAAASERDRLVMRVTTLEAQVEAFKVIAGEIGSENSRLVGEVERLKAENDRHRAELGRRDDALYSIHKISAAYEAHINRSPASDDLPLTTTEDDS